MTRNRQPTTDNRFEDHECVSLFDAMVMRARQSE
jgi:hypothetical protein